MQNALNNLLGEGAVSVKTPKLAFGASTSGYTYDITFQNPGDIILRAATVPTSEPRPENSTTMTPYPDFSLTATNLVEKTKGNKGVTSLTINREAPSLLEQVSGDGPLSSFVGAAYGETTFESFTFTDIHANTIIRGGINENTFSISGGATFAGTIIEIGRAHV